MNVLKPCCHNFKPFSKAYLELTTPDDQWLLTLSEFVLRVNGLKSVSAEITDYLNRKIIREHILFKRSLQDCSLKPPELKAEIRRIRKELKKLPHPKLPC